MEMREGRQGSDPAVETGAAADAGPTRYIDPDAERRRRDEAREGPDGDRECAPGRGSSSGPDGL